jgi:hypothetical protein
MNLLSRNELKAIKGGFSGSCSCYLTSSEGNHTLKVAISSADSQTGEDCAAACKTYCDNAEGCGSWSSGWTNQG